MANIDYSNEEQVLFDVLKPKTRQLVKNFIPKTAQQLIDEVD